VKENIYCVYNYDTYNGMSGLEYKWCLISISSENRIEVSEAVCVGEMREEKKERKKVL